jgi:hypothetical protein
MDWVEEIGLQTGKVWRKWKQKGSLQSYFPHMVGTGFQSNRQQPIHWHQGTSFLFKD